MDTAGKDIEVCLQHFPDPLRLTRIKDTVGSQALILIGQQIKGGFGEYLILLLILLILLPLLLRR